MFQGDLNSMIARYDIIRQAELYRDDIAVVALDEECDRRHRPPRRPMSC